MAKGIIDGTTSNQYIDVKLEWESVPRIAGRLIYSQVYASLYYKRNNEGYETTGTGTFTFKFTQPADGGGTNSYSFTKTITITEGSWTKIECARTVSILHREDDATGYTDVTVEGSIPGTSLEWTSLSGRMVFDPIERATTIDSLSSSNYFTGTMTYKYTPKFANLYNRCNIVLDVNGTITAVKTINLGQKATSQQTDTVTLQANDDELFKIYRKLPSSTSGKLRFTLLTYSDSGYSTQVGEASSKEITLTIPNDATTQPTVSMALSSVGSLPSEYSGLYIQGFSKVKATSFTATPKYDASIEASNITVEGISYGPPYESGILSQSGTVSVKATAKDSRGFYGTYYKEIEVIPYSRPYLTAKSNENSIIVARCDQSANFTPSGTYLKIKAKIVYSKVMSGGKQKNYGFIKFRYRQEGGAYSGWQTILNCETQNSDEVITAPLLNGDLAITSNYQVQLIVSDDFGDSAPLTFAIPSESVYMHRPAGGKSMGLGGYSTGDGKLDVYWKTMARGGLSLFDTQGNEIPLVSTMPLPRGQVAEGWNPNNLENGIYVVTNAKALKSGDTVIMYNGVLIQMNGTVDGSVKIQLALTSDENKNPFYRAYWYGNWGNWRSFKL